MSTCPAPAASPAGATATAGPRRHAARRGRHRVVRPESPAVRQGRVSHTRPDRADSRPVPNGLVSSTAERASKVRRPCLVIRSTSTSSAARKAPRAATLVRVDARAAPSASARPRSGRRGWTAGGASTASITSSPGESAASSAAAAAPGRPSRSARSRGTRPRWRPRWARRARRRSSGAGVKPGE